MGVASRETNKLSTTRVDAAVDVSRDGSAILPASTESRFAIRRESAFFMDLRQVVSVPQWFFWIAW